MTITFSKKTIENASYSKFFAGLEICSFALHLFALVALLKRAAGANYSYRSLLKEQQEQFAQFAFTKRALCSIRLYQRQTRAIRSFKRANRLFALKKQGIHTKNQIANS